MGRTTEILTISLPPKIAKEVSKVARQENKTKSELFRSAFVNYIESKKMIPIVKLTSAEKKSLEKARKEMSQGEYLTLKELEHGMEPAHRKKRS